MKKKITLWTNTVLLSAAALWFFLLPALLLIGDVNDPALKTGGIPRSVFAWHRHLSPDFATWAKTCVTSQQGKKAGQKDVAATEWPAHSAMFYLLATEELQKAWEKDHSLSAVAPAVYAREAIDASAELLMDPVNAQWVRNYWGDDKYLKTQNVFFRMMVINGLTAHLALTGDRSSVPFLQDQADSMAAEFDASPWGLLDDYPGECYPTDIVPCIAGIQRVDRLTGSDHSAMIARAVRVMEGGVLDPECGLPGYFVNMHTGQTLQPARGTGLSITTIWTPQLWPTRSAAWYADYVDKFWQENTMLAGFREFRKSAGYGEYTTEIDAGPIVAGYGTSASAFGIGAARAHGDYPRAYAMTVEAMAGAWSLPNGTLSGARVLSTADAPYTGVTALLFALTRESGQIKFPTTRELADSAVNLVISPIRAASTTSNNLRESAKSADNLPVSFRPTEFRMPGFVILLIGGGLMLGLLFLLACWLRIRRVRRSTGEMGDFAFRFWCALTLLGGVLWFIHADWAMMPLFAAQWFPRVKKVVGK